MNCGNDVDNPDICEAYDICDALDSIDAFLCTMVGTIAGSGELDGSLPVLCKE